MKRLLCRWTSALTSAAVLTAGCDNSMSPMAAGTTQEVVFRLGAAASGSTTDAPPLTALRVVVGQASLGSGEQYGCADCQDQDGETPAEPALVDVPVNGGAVDVASEKVQQGTYSAVEIEIVHPTAALLAQTPDWPENATIEISGEFNGKAFTLPLAVEGHLRQQLAEPVIVGAGGTPATIRINIALPVADWFTGPSGILDPTDPAQRTMIEANVRRILAYEDPQAPEG